MNTKILVRLPEAAAILSMSERALWARPSGTRSRHLPLDDLDFFSVVALKEWIETKFNEGIKHV